MKNQIYISWGSGNSIFYLPEFFPCTQAKLKKFVKLLKTDFETRDENINTCVDYLNNTISALSLKIIIFSKSFFSLKNEKSSLEERIKSNKQQNGVPLTSEEIREMKSELKQVKRKLKNIDEILNSYAVLKSKLEKNLGTLKKLCDVT